MNSESDLSAHVSALRADLCLSPAMKVGVDEIGIVLKDVAVRVVVTKTTHPILEVVVMKAGGTISIVDMSVIAPRIVVQMMVSVEGVVAMKKGVIIVVIEGVAILALPVTEMSEVEGITATMNLTKVDTVGVTANTNAELSQKYSFYC